MDFVDSMEHMDSMDCISDMHIQYEYSVWKYSSIDETISPWQHGSCMVMRNPSESVYSPYGAPIKPTLLSLYILDMRAGVWIAWAA